MAEDPTGSKAPTVAVAGADFGWGSSGKLSAVVTALRARSVRPPRFVGLASSLGRPVLAEHGIDRWYDVPADDPAAVAEVVRAEGVTAGLVVLEGPAAMALEAAGVPTVFVDSLPFLWTEGDLPGLPLDVSVYCAQRCVELPPECRDVLASVANLHWVGAVVANGRMPDSRMPGDRLSGDRLSGGGPSATGRAPDGLVRRALLNLGGLRSPHLPDWTRYPRLVVPAALAALEAFGVEEVHVAGNVPDGIVSGLRPGSGPGSALRVTAGPLGHGAFLDRLADCDVLVTSPGLTTLLEAGALAAPVVCLPPQNLSQIFNGRFHSSAVGADVRVRWPDEVFREESVLENRASEDTALRMIYGGIAGADTARVRPALSRALLAALGRARDGADWKGLTDAVGTDGADRVARHVLTLMARAAHH
ncbi:hydroxymethylcytosylglucuronate/cytosylglucuronate synthase [Streptomyces sp. NPDC053048]|uniref:hydroxymethylcytosylglucuronate/cytosylglucurona te synthase n=1 Tax=Streptomyces sp. NPDC053048 TaxID=3365694 RepID=UPI0037CECDAF